MTETPNLAAYTVALSFAEGGPIVSNAVIAPSAIMAVAMVVVDLMQQAPTDKELIGVAVAQITPEFLRMALRAHEGALKPGGENVISMVRPPDKPDPDAFSFPGADYVNRRGEALLRGDTLAERAGGKYTDPDWPHPPHDPARDA